MNPDLIKAQDVILEQISRFCRDFGLNNVMAQLYVILYFSHEPLSLDEMSERLKISKGSVSVNIRALERYGVVRRVWVKGTRKDFYEAEHDIAKVIMDRAKSMVERRLGSVAEMTALAGSFVEKSQQVSEEDQKAAQVFKERLQQLKDMQAKISMLVQLLNFNFSDLPLPVNDKTKDAEPGAEGKA